MTESVPPVTGADRHARDGGPARHRHRNSARPPSTRLGGHGLDGESLAAARVSDWSRDVAEAIQAEGGKVERSQVVLNTAIKTLGVHEVLVRLHAEVRATVKINIARSMDEAERQAKGEDVIRSQFDDERQAAEQSAQELIEGGAGQQEGFGEEAGKGCGQGRGQGRG